LLIHDNKQYTKCNKEFIYFVKNSSTFIFEKFLKCQYISIVQKFVDKTTNLISITNYNPLFSLITGQCYNVIGILDIYKENVIITGTKKIFIIIKILGLKLDLHENSHKRIWYKLITTFHPIIKTSTFLDKIKSILFQNISGFEILKTVISCLLFIGYHEYKNTLMYISEKAIIGLISYPGFYNLLMNRLSNFSYNNSFINLKKVETTHYQKTKKKLFINDYMKKFKNKYNNILIFENFEILNNIFHDFLYELNETENYFLTINDHHLNFKLSIVIISNLNVAVEHNLIYLIQKKKKNRPNTLINILKYYDLIFDIKRNISSNIIIEKNSATILHNMSFFNSTLQKIQYIIINTNYFLIIHKIKNLKIAYFSEYLLKYIIKIFVTYRKFGGFFDINIMNTKNLNLILKLSRIIAKANQSTYIKKNHIDEAFKIIGYSQINSIDQYIFQKFKPIRHNYFNIIKKIILNIFFKVNILSIGKLFLNLKKLGIPISYSNYVIFTFLINQKIIMIGNYLKINNNYNVVK